MADRNQWGEEQKKKEWQAYCNRESAFLRKRRTRTNLSQFQILAQIGQGGYGQVFLVRKKDSNEICALKKMNKKLLNKMNEVDHILTERDVLTQTRSPWLTKLMYAFQDLQSVYLAMEYVPGGDMRTLLNKTGIMHEHDAKFYVAEMFMSVHELHRLGYIHRDLKPENFLVDRRGHLKLTDFGLSKGQLSVNRVESLKEKLIAIKDAHVLRFTSLERKNIHKTFRGEDSTRAFTLVGSPDYMAPEVLSSSNQSGKSGVYAAGYDYLVDYWSLGCIMFEALSGYPPFAGPSMEDVWVNIYHWQEVIERPKYEGEDEEFNMSDEAWNLIMRLISHRHLRSPSVVQVHNHPWFVEFNAKIKKHLTTVIPRPPQTSTYWEHLHIVPPSVISPPFTPELQSDLDHQHFDDFSDPNSTEMYKEVYEKQKAWDREIDQESMLSLDEFEKSKELRIPYVGFTYRHKEAVNWNRIENEITTPTTPQRWNPKQWMTRVTSTHEQ